MTNGNCGTKEDPKELKSVYDQPEYAKIKAAWRGIDCLAQGIRSSYVRLPSIEVDPILQRKFNPVSSQLPSVAVELEGDPQTNKTIPVKSRMHVFFESQIMRTRL